MLAVPAPAKEPEEKEIGGSASAALATPCPCCGGRMLVIEIFEAGQTPHNRPKAAVSVIRVDTS